MSTATGTVIQTSDISRAGGTPANYYEDNSTPRPVCTPLNGPECDTGDLKRYGDTGTIVAGPNLNFTYFFNLYFLAGRQANLGSTYQAYFAQPLHAVAQRKGPVYLPLVVR